MEKREARYPTPSAILVTSVRIVLMPVARKIGLAILSPLFVFLLFATAFDIGFVNIATHPTEVKKMVAESGVYSAVVPNVLSQVKSIPTSYGDISTDNPLVQKATRASLSPMYIQQNTELAIDNIYQWLDGKISQPNFNIDLSGVKTLFANNIADSLQKQLAALPACSLAQSRAIAAAGSFDAVNATCLPRGVSPVAIAEQVQAGIVNQQDFLKDTTVGTASLKTPDGQPVFEQKGVKDIPKQYQNAKKSPWILSILTVLAGAGIVFLSSSRQKGLRHIGINLLVIGAVMLVFAWILNRTVNTEIIPKIKVDNAIFQQDIRALITDVAQRIDKNYWLFGGLYFVLGAATVTGALLAAWRQGPGTPDNTAAGYRAPARHPNMPPASPPKPKAD